MAVTIDIESDASEGVQAMQKVVDKENESLKNNKRLLLVQSALLTAKKAVLAIGSGLAAVTAISAIKDRVTAIVEETMAYRDLGQELRITTARARNYAEAERRSGLADGSVANGIVAVAQAQGRNAAELKRLGFTYEQIRQMSPADIFDTLAKRMAEGSVTGRDLADVMTVLGGNQELVSALSGEFSVLNEQITNANLGLTNDTVEKLYGGFTNLVEAARDLGTEVAQTVTPAFNGLVGALSTVLDVAGQAIDGFRVTGDTLVSAAVSIFSGNSLSETFEFMEQEQKLMMERIESERKRRVEAANSRTPAVQFARNAGAISELDQFGARLGRSQQTGGLARVGLFGTSAQAESARLARQGARHLSQIAEEMAKVTENTEKTAANTE